MCFRVVVKLRNFIVDRKLQILQQMVAELAVAGLAPGSWKNFITHARKYREFCTTLRLYPFPMTEDKLCLYIAFLTLTLTTHGSVQGYVAGVRKLFAYARVHWLNSTTYVDLVMDGVKRVLDHVTVRAEPMTPEILLLIAEKVDVKSVFQVVCFKAMLISFCLFLRSSNVVSPTTKTYDE